MSPRLPYNMMGEENWVQKILKYRSFQSNKPIPNPSHDRTGQPVGRFDETEQPVVGTNTKNLSEGSQIRSCHESISFKFENETIRENGTTRCNS